jgi:hypothetical protein
MDVGTELLRALLDALYRADKIALWQQARAIEADANRLSLERLRDVAHRVAVLIARGRPDDALALADELKAALKDALSVVQSIVDAA